MNDDTVNGDLHYDAFRESIRRDPRNLNLRKRFAARLLADGYCNDAVEQLKSVLESSVKDEQAYLLLCDAYLKQDKREAASVLLEQAGNVCENKHVFTTRLRRLEMEKETETIPVSLPDETEPVSHGGFGTVVGLDTQKQELYYTIIYPISSPHIYQAFQRRFGTKLLFYGPAGCGKTTLVRAAAAECVCPLTEAGLTDVLSMFAGQSEKNIQRVFERARTSTPSLLFCDEVEALAADRRLMTSALGKNLVGQFLKELTGVNGNTDVAVLAATDSPWLIDRDFFSSSRFERVSFAPPPNREERAELFRRSTAEVPLAPGIDINALAAKSRWFTGNDIKRAVDLAVDGALASSLKRGRIQPLRQSDLARAVSSFRPDTRRWLEEACDFATYADRAGRFREVLDWRRGHAHS